MKRRIEMTLTTTVEAVAPVAKSSVTMSKGGDAMKRYDAGRKSWGILINARAGRPAGSLSRSGSNDAKAMTPEPVS
jgi:hypothetical protein